MTRVLSRQPLLVISPLGFVTDGSGGLTSSVIRISQERATNVRRITGGQDAANTYINGCTETKSTDKHVELSCQAGTSQDYHAAQWSQIDHTGGSR